MEKVTVFKADDGEVFEDEYDCQMYEWETQARKGTFTLLGEDYKPMPIDNPASYNNCVFIYAPTRDSLIELYGILDSDLLCAEYPDFLEDLDGADTGLYKWDTFLETWVHVASVINKLTADLNACKEALGVDKV